MLFMLIQKQSQFYSADKIKNKVALPSVSVFHFGGVFVLYVKLQLFPVFFFEDSVTGSAYKGSRVAKLCKSILGAKKSVCFPCQFHH